MTGIDTGSYAGWIAAMEDRRKFFRAHGAVSTDHSHADARVEPIADAEAERLYRRARNGTITAEEGDTRRRNHHTPTFEALGPDVGADIPTAVEFTDAIRPMLEAFGTTPGFRVILFTIDETVYSRELAPLAGFYPSVYVGTPWWFIDAPDAIDRYRRAVTETAGFTRTSGTIDDTRALLSIPARHDTNRRMDAGFLARLVADHRLTLDEARETAVDLVVTSPRKAFRL